jgi:hypothetical protein
MLAPVKVLALFTWMAGLAASWPQVAAGEPRPGAQPEDRIEYVTAAACARQRAPRIPFRSPARWGWWEEMAGDAPVSACSGDGRSTMIGAEQVAESEGFSIFAGVVEDRRVARGSSRRVGVSFAIPEAGFPQWNHTAALLAFDDRSASHRRAGAAVFLTELAIELDDRECVDETNLFSFVPLARELEPERWYRLEAGAETTPEGLVLAASVSDLATGQLLGATAHTFACADSWMSRARMAAAFLATVDATEPDTPEMAIDDYVAVAMRPR